MLYGKIDMIIKLLIILTVIFAQTINSQWQERYSPTSANLNDVVFRNDTTGIIAGDNGKFLISLNAGENWQLIETDSTINYFSVDFLGDKKAILVGSIGIMVLVHTDTGNWEYLNSNTSSNIYDIEFVNDSTGYFITRKQLYKTIDWGNTWNIVYSGPDLIYSFDFANENNGLIAGMSNFSPGYEMVKSTSNGGESWELWGSYGYNTFWDIYCIDHNFGYAINDYYFFKTSQEMRMNPIYVFQNVYSLKKMFFINNQKGWIVSSDYWPRNSTIYASNDAGSNWSEEFEATYQLNGIYFLSENIGWAVGDSGSILKYNSISNTVEKNYITDFYLFQNYPNPFNPNTTISYVIPEQTHVSLKVFEGLGKEVATLVNKEQSQGNYQVEFIATNQATGIYFYRINAGDFVETKKMILMK